MSVDREDPVRLTVVGATRLERHLLDAAASEQPSPEHTRRMRAALGLSIAGVVTASSAAASALAPASGLAKVAATKLAAGWMAAGILTAAALGGVAAIRLSSTRLPASTLPAASRPVLPAPAAAALPPASPLPSVADPDSPKRRAPRAASSDLRPSARRRATGPAPERDLQGQIALIDAARTAVRTGAPDQALSLLHRYRATYPVGTFRPEATALEIEALAASGQRDRAAALAQQFLSQHPDSPLAIRVARYTDSAAR